MCSGSEAGSYLRLIDFVYHSTLGLRVIQKKKKLYALERLYGVQFHMPLTRRPDQAWAELPVDQLRQSQEL